MTDRLASKVLLIGWDAADWQMINPLLQAGHMPRLQQLISTGASGNIGTLEPVLSPMLWTSIATGKTADKHGILGFVEPKEDRSGLRPATSLSRKCKAIWNILNQNGLRSQVFNWFASYPAEPINGVCVSNHFPHPVGRPEDPWPMKPDDVHPAELAEAMSMLRVHPGELGPDEIAPFVRDASKLDIQKDEDFRSLISMLAQCVSVHSASTWAIENEPWDFCAIYHQAIDHFGHVFMPYHPPAMDPSKEAQNAAYSDVMVGIYRFHDMMLGRLLDLAGDDTTVIIVSDHGFHSDHLRPGPNAGPVSWHRPFGVLCVNGPNIEKTEIFGASLLDITPTILTLFGLPIGDDMDGKPLVQIIKPDITPKRVRSWEYEPGDAGTHPADRQFDSVADHEMMQRLVELGYVDAPSGDEKETLQRAYDDMTMNLAEVHRTSGRNAEALEAYERLLNDHPKSFSFALRVAQCRLAVADYEGCRAIVDEKLSQFADRPIVNMLRGNLALTEKKPEEALAFYRAAEKQDPRMPGIYAQIGYVFLNMNEWEDAERVFNTALSIDPDAPPVIHGLGVSMLGLGRIEEAVDAFLRTVELRYHYPKAHFHLGQALARAGRIQEAAQAFHTCSEMLPKAPAPIKALVYIHRELLKDDATASTYEQRLREVTLDQQASVAQAHIEVFGMHDDPLDESTK